METVVVIAVIVIIVVAIASNSNNAAKTLRNAKEAYDQSLVALKKNPTNPDLKQKTLELGRRYSSLLRQMNGSKGGVTIFDEVALSNDISAACAAAHTTSAPAASIDQRLSKLDDLKSRGVISDAEYASQRSRILADV